jgi:hypothetical protein
MYELDRVRVQQQSTAVEMLPEKIVVSAVSVGGIADHRVKDVFHVPPYLVVAACLRPHLEKRIPCRFIPAYRLKQRLFVDAAP